MREDRVAKDKRFKVHYKKKQPLIPQTDPTAASEVTQDDHGLLTTINTSKDTADNEDKEGRNHTPFRRKGSL